jgi:urease accessory protein
MAAEGKGLHLLLCLSDSNLPTGGFVASSSLESYVHHGFLHQHRQAKGCSVTEALLAFVEHNLTSYARLALPFIHDAYRIIQSATADEAVEAICALDALHHTMLSNPISRRASKAQGAALLTLYARSLKDPRRVTPADAIIEQLKTYSLSSKHPYEGHLPVCWGVVSAAIGLSPGKFIYRHHDV